MNHSKYTQQFQINELPTLNLASFYRKLSVHVNNPSALKKLSRKHERKAPSDYMGKKFAALPNPAARLTSASFIFLIRRYGRKRQTINRTNGTSVRSAKRYNFSIYTRA